MYELYLAHHGIKGQRWGVRRYQNPDGTLTEAGKKHYGGVESAPRHKPSEARKKAREEEKARKFEEKRQQALKTGSATEIMKYKNFSTQKELQDAISRINTERTLKQLSDAELNSGKKFIDKVIDTADTWRARGEKVANAWNFVAKIHNSLVDEDDAWQKIGEKSVKEAKRERAKEKAEKAHKDAMEQLLVEDAVKNGDYDKVAKYIDRMSPKDAKSALERIRMDPDSKIQSKRERLIAKYIINYGSGKKREAYLEKLSTAQIEELIKNAENAEQEEKGKRKKKEEDD